MDLLLDENLPRSLSTLLRQHGHRVQSVKGSHLEGASDTEVFAVCVNRHKLLVTLDLDFANIRHYPPQTSPGIVVIHVKRQSTSRIVRAMSQFLQVASLEQCRGHLTIVEDTDYRIRAEL